MVEIRLGCENPWTVCTALWANERAAFSLDCDSCNGMGKGITFMTRIPVH